MTNVYRAGDLFRGLSSTPSIVETPETTPRYKGRQLLLFERGVVEELLDDSTVESIFENEETQTTKTEEMDLEPYLEGLDLDSDGEFDTYLIHEGINPEYYKVYEALKLGMIKADIDLRLKGRKERQNDYDAYSSKVRIFEQSLASYKSRNELRLYKRIFNILNTDRIVDLVGLDPDVFRRYELLLNQKLYFRRMATHPRGENVLVADKLKKHSEVAERRFREFSEAQELDNGRFIFTYSFFNDIG